MLRFARNDGVGGGGGRALSLVRALGALLLIVLLPLPASALEPEDLKLTVTPELPGNAPPFAREMVLLKLHGVYRTQILLEEVRQPPLTNFSWTQLGRDAWGRERMADGQMALSFDRTIAVFPQHTGTFTIEPFTHKLTVNDNGERRVVEVRSEPIPFPVGKWTEASGGPDAPEPWWLPARDVTVTDSWEPDPETIKEGETARRIVTVEAQGILAEGMPPRPVMRTRGIITFAGPVKRETLITPQGPVAKATYQWDIKKGVPETVALNEIKIPWFDTNSRTMREAEIPARQIGGGLPDREEDLGKRDPASWASIFGAGFLAFGLGLVLLGFGVAPAKLGLTRAESRALRRAAAAGDAKTFRAELDRAARAHPELAALWRSEPETAALLTRLDAAVYGGADAMAPDLRALATSLSRRRRAQREALPADARLAPLDGPGASPA